MNDKKRPERREFKAILFDKDGVLIDSLDLCLRAANATLKHYDKPEMGREEFRTKFWGRRADQNFANQFGNISQEKVDEIYDYYNNKKLEFKDSVNLFPNVRVVLESLHGKYKLGIVTSSISDVSQKILEDLGVMKYFEVMVAGKDAKPKPAPDPILKACELLDIDINETMYIGDTIPDIEAGNAAGCKVVMVTTSFSREELDGFKDIRIIDDLKEVLEILM